MTRPDSSDTTFWTVATREKTYQNFVGLEDPAYTEGMYYQEVIRH